jgi:tRNA (cmo5U34)-methyltransferase
MRVSDKIESGRASWSFDGNVPDAFVEHVRQSVPFYDEGHELICGLSDYFCQNDSTCYEIGVSTGQLIRRLAEHNKQKPGISWIGIDPIDGMITKAREHCTGIPNVQLEVGDALSYDFARADLIVSYYCVQFVKPRQRQDLINRLYETLHWGGALIMFEKVRAPDARFQDIITGLYSDFKAKNGFTAEEILNKTSSLKGVLEPFSTEGNLGLLRRAGFVDIMTVMKHLCFEGFLAIK